MGGHLAQARPLPSAALARLAVVSLLSVKSGRPKVAKDRVAQNQVAQDQAGAILAICRLFRPR